MKKVLMVLMVAALVTGCSGIGVQVQGNQQEAVTLGLEMLAFNGGYLLAEKYPGKYQEVMAEIAVVEAALSGSNAEAANAAFQLGVQKLLAATNNDPLVKANVSFIASKIKFVDTGAGSKPLIDVPTMKLIVTNFKAGAEARAILGYAR